MKTFRPLDPPEVLKKLPSYPPLLSFFFNISKKNQIQNSLVHLEKKTLTTSVEILRNHSIFLPLWCGFHSLFGAPKVKNSKKIRFDWKVKYLHFDQINDNIFSYETSSIASWLCASSYFCQIQLLWVSKVKTTILYIFGFVCI